jgi:pyruvate/2-oxoglutarate/acetoin dehydrogenase E1 component/TPP-dependent pyruvate/acetoin dehydrogenase alpha subunit
MSEAATSVKFPKAEIIADYRLAFMSREASRQGRSEVHRGKAKFGIFGDGKELPQLAMARTFRKGDWRSGYYRDQTWMFAVGAADIKQFFAQLYADTDREHEPASAGRQMNAHFSTRYLDDQGGWLDQCTMYNTSADVSATACQMGRAVGLAYASKIYRQSPSLSSASKFSHKGDEVAFATIGNAATSEGLFWEAINAAGVLQIPLVVSVWDDDYGISVHNRYQTVKGSISEALRGFQRADGVEGIDIYVVRGWDYVALRETYERCIEKVRREHVPALIHVTELTQPQGHSTSGSHERYKSEQRLRYEESVDCLRKMREWILSVGIATPSEIEALEEQGRAEVTRLREEAWCEYIEPLQREIAEAANFYEELTEAGLAGQTLRDAATDLRGLQVPTRKGIQSSLKRAMFTLSREDADARERLRTYARRYEAANRLRYNTFLYAESKHSPLHVPEVRAEYPESPETVPGSEIIQRCFDLILERDPRVFVIGEDIGQLGGVNHEFVGLFAKHAGLRVTDTGIREATILGQGIGAAMRGLRPIVDIQYLDYLLYCFQVMSDDLATLHYRSAAGQAAPVIVRTKGHRLEGIWHTGSPMSMILGGVRGAHVCVPRNMTQAAGFYNTLLKGDDPAIVIEVLNGYRIKESVPSNLGEFTVPLGCPEILLEGDDVTVVSYGACCRIAVEAAKLLKRRGIGIELIDVQTLLPFDLQGAITRSLDKTNLVLFLDEDVPGGATAFMMQQVLENQGGYHYLDGPPRTLSAATHRSPYGTDGDYYSKPNAEAIAETVYEMMRERHPARFPEL